MKPYVRMILSGASAGLFSALLWAGFGYLTSAELGWIAWGVGFLVGLAIRLVGVEGWTPGIVAVAISVLAIIGGKYLTVRFIVAKEFAVVAQEFEHLDPEDAKVELAKDVVAEYESQKKKLNWPEKKRLLTSATKGPQMASEFPADVWKETNRRWEKLTADQKEQRTAVAKLNMEQQLAEAKTRARSQAFEQSFSVFDILWFLLATVTAFRVALGAVHKEH